MVIRHVTREDFHTPDVEWGRPSDSLLRPLGAIWGHSTTLAGAKRVTPNPGVPIVISGVGDEDVTWLGPVLDSAAGLLVLPEDWDSYGAPQIDPEKVAFGIRMLLANLDQAAPTPAVVPTNSGGLQFEWHMASIDLEIEVVSSGRVNVFYENHRTGATTERTLTSNFRPLNEFLAELLG